MSRIFPLDIALLHKETVRLFFKFIYDLKLNQ